MMSNFDVFGAAVMNWILGNSMSTEGIGVKLNGADFKIELLE